ncbi:MBL fold metallo-hydrolase [Micromonospora rubida]|uniref:MBL fold metallo-hydrolase n=1 Tax=Micromonospora rubida TaxID=2697657 RepID=A0ABW7SHS8_9ACTN
MRLTVIGCSGSAPGPDAACSCYLVEQDGWRLLLDLGTGAVGPLQRHAPVTALDAVFVTHAHGDHCDDLVALAYLRSVAGDAGVLPVYGPSAVESRLADRLSAHRGFAFGPAPERIGPYRVRTAVARHQVENWAVRLDDQLCYTGDSAPCDALDDLAHGCAVVLAEASGFDDETVPNHLTAGDAGRLARRAEAQLLVLTHIRPWHRDRAADLLAEAARHSSCPVVLATAGLTLTL